MNLPLDLAEGAAAFLGKASLTEAVRDALREAMHRQACADLLKIREQGGVDLKVDWRALRASDDA